MAGAVLHQSVYRRGIGLLGGTFDPIHNGHLAVAQGALRELRLARVDFVPAPSPWQKDVLTPVTRRIEMIQAAIETEPLMGVNLGRQPLRGAAPGPNLYHRYAPGAAHCAWLVAAACSHCRRRPMGKLSHVEELASPA